MTTHATKNKLVVITGVTRGLGLAMAAGFIRAGLSVAGCGRSVERITQLHREYGQPHDFAVVDIADETQVHRWAVRMLNSLGAPDLLINNAALINRNAPLWQITAKEFSLIVDVNLKTPPPTQRRGSGLRGPCHSYCRSTVLTTANL